MRLRFLKYLFCYSILFFSISCRKVNLPKTIVLKRNYDRDKYYKNKISGLIEANCKKDQDYSDEDFILKLRNVSISHNKIPQEFDGFKIGIFTDLHIRYISETQLNKICKIFKEKKVDIIFFGGDLINTNANELTEGKISILSRLPHLCDYGVVAILGNHDYGTYRFLHSGKENKNHNDKLNKIYKKLGWKLLKDQHIKIHKKSGTLKIIGIEFIGICSTVKNKGSLKKAKKNLHSEFGIPTFANNKEFEILLAHDPDIWDNLLKSEDIPLTISGHTHGATKTADFSLFNPKHLLYLIKKVKSNKTNIDLIKSRPGRITHKYSGGLYKKKIKDREYYQYIYVDKGIGTIGSSADNIKFGKAKFSLDFVVRNRAGIPAEISIITLKTNQNKFLNEKNKI